LAFPLGVACRFRVFSEKRSSERIGFFRSQPALRTLRALRFLVFPRLPHCLARPRRLLPPTVWLPFRVFSRRSRPSPLDVGTSRLRISRPFGASVPKEST
jgi:hypothetical protein